MCSLKGGRMIDTSELIIEKLKKAPEIQKLYDHSQVNFLWDCTLRQGTAHPFMRYEEDAPDTPEKWKIGGRLIFDAGDGYLWDAIWVPRQDQYQTMFQGVYVDPRPRKLVLSLWNWIAMTAPGDLSMDQLWLDFVMHERFKKEWDPQTSNWVPVSEK
jgi:hypothetical protein